MNKKQLKNKLEKVKKRQEKLDKERSALEREIANVDLKDKRINFYQHRSNSEGYTFDFDEMKIIGEEIGTTGDSMEFSICKFKDNTFGFFINTATQGNFLLTRKEVDEILKFIKVSVTTKKLEAEK